MGLKTYWFRGDEQCQGTSRMGNQAEVLLNRNQRFTDLFQGADCFSQFLDAVGFSFLRDMHSERLVLFINIQMPPVLFHNEANHGQEQKARSARLGVIVHMFSSFPAPIGEMPIPSEQ